MAGIGIGSGNRVTRKKCYSRENIRNKRSHTFHFPTDNSALRWNMEWEKKIRHAGHLTTLGLIGAASLLGPEASIAVGAIMAIAKDELQAKVPYPRMARGWSFEVIYEHQFKWTPLDESPNRSFTQTVTSITRDFKGEIVKSSTVKNRFKLEELPDGFARRLASKPSKKTKSDY